MRRHLVAAALVAQLSLVTVVTARAADPATAVLAIAAASLIAVLGLGRLDPPSRGVPGALGLLDPAWSLALLVRRRLPATALVPAWAASIVGALVGGLLGGIVVARLPRLLVQDQPDLVAAGIVLGAVGVGSCWTVLWADRAAGGKSAAEARAAAGTTALPAISATAALPAVFVGAANPAVLFAVGVSGQADWSYVLVAALCLTAAVVVTAVLGTAVPARRAPDPR